jgi:hypothetical protein
VVFPYRRCWTVFLAMLSISIFTRESRSFKLMDDRPSHPRSPNTVYSGHPGGEEMASSLLRRITNDRSLPAMGRP